MCVGGGDDCVCVGEGEMVVCDGVWYSVIVCERSETYNDAMKEAEVVVFALAEL
jgi:hypothetical protein